MCMKDAFASIFIGFFLFFAMCIHVPCALHYLRIKTNSILQRSFSGQRFPFLVSEGWEAVLSMFIVGKGSSYVLFA